jgi:hypothetical protein
MPARPRGASSHVSGANFLEPPQGELLGITIPRDWQNRDENGYSVAV